MAAEFRAWAMRTSREEQSHREFIRKELDSGRLRQGWGYLADQDLRTIQSILDDKSKGWATLSEDQRNAWRHWRMLGEGLHDDGAGMRVGDIVLVPNMPDDRYFSLYRITGPYQYSIDQATITQGFGPHCAGDFGHFREVEPLTPGGVANINNLVSSELRSSLRCRSRLWWLGAHQGSIEAIIAAAASHPEELRKETDHVRRAERNVNLIFRENLDQLAGKIAEPLRSNIRAAEWEPVLRQALLPLLRDVNVVAIGGAGEKGADLEIHFPNPFDWQNPWIVAVQVKDFDGTVPAYVADQLEEAIQARQGDDKSGQLVAVVLASTNARASDELKSRLDELSATYNVSVSCVHGADFMRVVAQGLFIGFRDGSI